MLRITWVVKPVVQWFWTGWGVVWFRSYQDKSIRGLQIVSWAVEAKRRVCMASSDRFLMKLFVCALIVWAAVLLSVPQRLYQSPGPHTPWGCVAAINAASQTERFVVSSISTYIGVGSNTLKLFCNALITTTLTLVDTGWWMACCLSLISPQYMLVIGGNLAI